MFDPADVEGLFGPADGGVAEQVASVERLGFLERIVVDDAGSAKSLFRIPQVYTPLSTTPAGSGPGLKPRMGRLVVVRVEDDGSPAYCRFGRLGLGGVRRPDRDR
jgi:hypothetical protein